MASNLRFQTHLCRIGQFSHCHLWSAYCSATLCPLKHLLDFRYHFESSTCRLNCDSSSLSLMVPNMRLKADGDSGSLASDAPTLKAFARIALVRSEMDLNRFFVCRIEDSLKEERKKERKKKSEFQSQYKGPLDSTWFHLAYSDLYAIIHSILSKYTTKMSVSNVCVFCYIQNKLHHVTQLVITFLYKFFDTQPDGAV